jgi:hypothetical protein
MWPEDEDTRKREQGNPAPVATSGQNGSGYGTKP